MSIMQEKIIRRVINMSDVDVRFLLEIIDRLIPQGKGDGQLVELNTKKEAFERLESLRGGFPADFDYDKELAEAREAKYGSFS